MDKKVKTIRHQKPWIGQGQGFGNFEWTLSISEIISGLSSTSTALITSWSCLSLVAPKMALATSGCFNTKAAIKELRLSKGGNKTQRKIDKTIMHNRLILCSVGMNEIRNHGINWNYIMVKCSKLSFIAQLRSLTTWIKAQSSQYEKERTILHHRDFPPKSNPTKFEHSFFFSNLLHCFLLIQFIPLLTILPNKTQYIVYQLSIWHGILISLRC